MSDPAIPHDHPWNYLSIILWGGYFEETVKITHIYTLNDKSLKYDVPHPVPWHDEKWYGPGSILYRRGDKFHKLIIPEGKYSISLIFTGKKWREWGFWDFYKGWISHKQKTY